MGFIYVGQSPKQRNRVVGRLCQGKVWCGHSMTILVNKTGCGYYICMYVYCAFLIILESENDVKTLKWHEVVVLSDGQWSGHLTGPNSHRKRSRSTVALRLFRTLIITAKLTKRPAISSIRLVSYILLKPIMPDLFSKKAFSFSNPRTYWFFPS